METLVLDGKEFVKASRAAKDLGYTADYVGQLCRSGKVQARLVGRTWYVQKDELAQHKVEKKRMSRVKAREQAKKTIDARRKQKADSNTGSRHVAIRYEEDESELIPQTRKVSVTQTEDTSLMVQQSTSVPDHPEEPQPRLGEIEVFDAGKSEQREFTVPIRASREVAAPRIDAIPVRHLEQVNDTQPEVLAEVVIVEPERVRSRSKPLAAATLLLVILCYIATATVRVYVYSSSEPQNLADTFIVVPGSVFDIIQDKI